MKQLLSETEHEVSTEDVMSSETQPDLRLVQASAELKDVTKQVTLARGPSVQMSTDDTRVKEDEVYMEGTFQVLNKGAISKDDATEAVLEELLTEEWLGWAEFHASKKAKKEVKLVGDPEFKVRYTYHKPQPDGTVERQGDFQVTYHLE